MIKCAVNFCIEFTLAFLLGIFGLAAIFYLCVFTNLEVYLEVAGCKSGVIIGMLIGVPTGSSLGVLVAKKCYLKTEKHFIRSFAASLIFSLLFVFLTLRFLFPLLRGVFDLGYSLDIVFFILVPLYAIVGYSIVERFSDAVVLRKNLPDG
jgi:hypothetical protein